MLLDQAPDEETFLKEALEGLRRHPKELPCKYLYDKRGSELFEEICRLDEYYPTRTEIDIMTRSAPEMGRCIGPRALVIEYGSGSGIKTRLLLGHLEEPAGFVPVDISRECLENTARRLSQVYEELPIIPVCGDFTQPLELPEISRQYRKAVVFFPGSTIGNFKPSDAAAFLKQIRRLCGHGGGLLIGVDLRKEKQVLEAAYNDRKGITAAFNLNLLSRMNRELETDFDVKSFRHQAVYNEKDGCIEMHLISFRNQVAHVGDEVIRFEEGESVVTERSFKYDPEQFRSLARSVDFEVRDVWTDSRRYFSVQYLEAC